VELNRLQANAGVFQSAADPRDGDHNEGDDPFDDGDGDAQEGNDNDPLAHWDDVVQDPDAVPPPLPGTARQTRRRTRSSTIRTLENQILILPSNRNAAPNNDDIELALRKNQAKTHLHQLRELIAEKSFFYSDVIRKASHKGIKTRARGSVKGINTQISWHCQVYSHCRSCLIELGADEKTLQHFRELKKDDVSASTAILKPNATGSTSLKLSWIWADVTRHILQDGDAEPMDADPATILECMSSISHSNCLSSFLPSQTCSLAACTSTTDAMA